MSLERDLKTEVYPAIKVCDIEGLYLKLISEDPTIVMKAKDICLNFTCRGINECCFYFQELNEL